MRVVVGLFLFVGVTALGAAPESPATTGFYPLWEGSGYVERAGAFRLGTTGTHVGVAGVAHVGVSPLPFMHRTPNLYSKLVLSDRPTLGISLQVSAYAMLNGAARGLFSPMYSTRLDNPDFRVWVVPVTASATHRIAPWLDLHQSLTLMGVTSGGPIRSEITPGYSLVAELHASSSSSLLLHAAQVGLWDHRFGLAGASVRYQGDWLELRAGYFYRMFVEGAQSGPLVGIGVLL